MTCTQSPGLGTALLAPFQGPPGIQGPKGDLGPVGPQGLQGLPGSPAGQTAPAFLAGAALAAHVAVRAIGDGTVAIASSDEPTQAGAVIGITSTSALQGGQVAVVIEGPVDDLSWSWCAGPVFLGLNGALTQSVPTSGVVLRIGKAVTATRILVSLAPPFLL